MKDGERITWQAKETGGGKKSMNWYWMIGIVAVGVAAAAVILNNYLFAVIAVIGGFAIMLAGSRQSSMRTYAVSEKGVHIGPERIPFENIKRFAIKEDSRTLTIETSGLLGTLSIPLAQADFRAIRTELKNHNIDEADSLGSLSEKFAEVIGM